MGLELSEKNHNTARSGVLIDDLLGNLGIELC